jgi:hypothetical protein
VVLLLVGRLEVQQTQQEQQVILDFLECQLFQLKNIMEK